MSNLEPKYTLFDSLEEMLSPETLSELFARTVTQVECQTIEDHGGVSGGTLSFVNTDAGRLVLKQMSLDSNWHMYYSDDRQCRSVGLWQYGLLDELLPHLEHKILACGRENGTSGILMHDLSDGLLRGWDNSILRELVPVFIDRMARIHATFWNDPRLENPRLGLCNASTYLDGTALTLNHTGNQRRPITGWIREGWKIMQKILDRDVYLNLRRLRDDPQPLIDTLTHYPFTLVHGDYWDGNLAFLKPDQPVIFDWQMAAHSLMTIDLVRYAGQFSVGAVQGKTQAISYYRGCLEAYLGSRFDEKTWQSMLDLGNLYNDLLIAWLPAYFSEHADDPDFRNFSRMRVEACNQHVHDGVRWL